MRHWQPYASIEAIKLRACVLKNIRAFFAQRNVLEVDTPILSTASISDPFIESFTTRYIPLTRKADQPQYYLHTSPEFPMKRLLAADLGSIYQIAKVFRQGEMGSRHNPEFTLLEWYREDYDHYQLMQEVDNLFSELLLPYIELSATQFMTYQQAFEGYLNLNPHTASNHELMSCCQGLGLGNVLDINDDKDRFLDLLFSHCVQPKLGTSKQQHDSKPSITFVYDYPASQASLARIQKKKGLQVAERFEIFIDGIELGNGFHELKDPVEQRRRFERDNCVRLLAGKPYIPLDERFLAALEHLPDCSGVAVGIERLLMIMLRAHDIREVINFPFDMA